MWFETTYEPFGSVELLWQSAVHAHRDRSQDLSWVLTNEITRMCYEVKDTDVARARNQLKASLLFMQDASQRKYYGGVGGWESAGFSWQVVHLHGSG